MPQDGVTCMEDGIHVKHEVGIPLGGIWYEETEQERIRVNVEWNNEKKEWSLLGKEEGHFVYTIGVEGQEEGGQWIRISDVCASTSIIAYPNPTSNVVYFKGLETDERHYELHDVMGRTVAIGNLSVTNNSIDMSMFAPGTYRLVLQGYGVIAIVKQ